MGGTLPPPMPHKDLYKMSLGNRLDNEKNNRENPIETVFPKKEVLVYG